MAVWRTVDMFLREEGRFAPGAILEGAARPPVGLYVALIVAAGLAYGAAMGSFSGLAGDGWLRIILAAAKVPIFFGVTFALCLPPFLILLTFAGLRDDLPAVLRGLLGALVLTTVILASAAPITCLMNLSATSYRFILIWNGIVFAFASGVGHLHLRGIYRSLIRARPRHRALLGGWFVLFVFVGIQMAWVLRPFVGAPELPVQLFREDAWTNAYVYVFRLVAGFLNEALR